MTIRWTGVKGHADAFAMVDERGKKAFSDIRDVVGYCGFFCECIQCFG
jgi:hypothetical protein